MLSCIIIPSDHGAWVLAESSGSVPVEDGVIGPMEYDGLQVIEDDRFEIYWTIINGTAHLGLRAHTTGWLSLGLDPTDGMQGADMIFGWVAGNGTTYMKDAYATDNLGSHPEDTSLGGSFDIDSFTGSESGGWTVIEFTRSLDTGDTYDKVISTTSPTDIIWAFGSTDTWTQKHSDRGNDRVTFTEAPAPPPPPSSDLDGIVSISEYGNKTTFNGGDFELYWNVEVSEIVIAMKARALGWISIGISPTDKMKDADMLFGWVDSTGTPFTEDAFSTGTTGPHPPDESLGGSYDIISYNGTESGGWTTIELRRKLSTTDMYDRDITIGTPINIIWGISDTDSFGAMHTAVGYGIWTVNKEAPPPLPEPSDNLDGIISPDEYGNMTSLDNERFHLSWKIHGSLISIGIRAQTTGYVSIGIDPTVQMKDADMIFGWVDSSGGAHAEDHYSTGSTGPHSNDTFLGGSFDIVEFNATEDSSWTSFEFVRKLDTGDEYDNPIPENGTVTLIWAVSNSDDTSAIHTRRGTFQWEIAGNDTIPPQPSQHTSDLDGAIMTGEYLYSAVFDSDRFELHWNVSDSVINIGMKAMTTGWISIGFDPSVQMKDADMIFGWVKDSVPYIGDMYSTGQTGPHPLDTDLGGTDDIMDYNGTESDGWTTIEFVRKLATGDEWDNDLPRTGNVTLIWGVSDSDDPSSLHSRRGSLTWHIGGDTTSGGEPPGSEPTTPSDLDGLISDGEYDDSSSFGNGSFVIHWRINDTEIYLGLEGETTGWVSIGLEPTRFMKDADMIFGWVDGSGAHGADTFSTGDYGPHPLDVDLGGTDDIMDLNGKQTDTHTVIELRRELDTGDEYDKPIPSMGSLSIIWALGSSDDISSLHEKRGSGTLFLYPRVTDRSGGLDGTVSTGEYEGTASFDFGNFTIMWTVHEDEIDVAMSARTDGWIAVGFDPEDVMQGADVYLGWADTDGAVHLVDAYATGPYGPHPPDTHMGGTDDIIHFNGTQVDGMTTIEFSRKLNTSDIYDKTIPSSGSIDIMWAYSEVDDFSESHVRSGFGLLSLGSGGVMSNNSGNGNMDGVISEGEYDFSGEFGGGVLKVHWKVKDDVIFMALEGKTTGWVSIGIDYTQAMADTDMIFGWVESDGTVKVVDAFSIGPTGPHPPDTELGGTDDIIDFGGSEENGITIIEFSRKLETSDEYDRPISLDNEVRIIWALGSTDSFSDKHANVGYGTIEISTGKTTSREPVLLWPIHAVFMSIGAGGMAAATVVLFKRKWKHFFRFHMYVMTGAVISAGIGLITGFIMVQASTGQHLRVIHSWFGLLTLIVTFGSMGVGLYFKYTKNPKHKKLTRTIHRYAGWVGVSMFILAAIFGFIQALFL